jgi:hypothetical protein
MMGHLEHPNIIPIHALGANSESEPVVVMKRVQGTPWHQRLEDKTISLQAYIETLIQLWGLWHRSRNLGNGIEQR